ncbi:sorbin and SH3 domain-containing protein 1 isoform X11 [Pieris napi]|uniref:sorbin and SH3 domain-containing protein 1 isoform X11 n=1 Tax=Pieris napi TaxID=78633 RepID=UPI001FBBEF76|nr:sorbin and SH3 domain-containing protein 1 isoform X11 [Pieris napi]
MTSKEVELTGGAPWGFRMHGGLDQNQPLRISRVNPGRKASLSGIREGDVITSINGQSTKNMTNSEAHAMLRSAGPSMRLGLNEDKEMSPRRRSIGKAADLKRPSQLMADLNNGKAVLQAPVYATIRPPQHRPTAPPLRSLSSPPTTYTSIVQEPPKIHPTNPFYTTLPLNCTSASRLPIPNGRFSTLDRNNSINKSKEPNYEFNSTLPNASELSQSQIFETRSVNIPITRETNMYYNENDSQSAAQDSRRNPFETKRNSDPFEKYHRPKANGTHAHTMLNSKSDTDFYSKEEIVKHSVIEEKISEIEEVKTIKKMVLNGSSDAIDKSNGLQHLKNHSKVSDLRNNSQNEYIITPTLENYNEFNKNGGNLERRLSSSVIYKSPRNHYQPQVDEQPVDVSKPPLKSPSSTLTPSPNSQQTVMIAPTFKARSTSPAVWTPGAQPPAGDSGSSAATPPVPPPPPVWTPNSATASPQTPRKTFRPVHFEESPPARRKFENKEPNGCMSGSEGESRLRTSHSAPVTGFNSLGSKLPKAPNPTVTLLQKAREGQLSRASQQVQGDSNSRLPRDRPSPPFGDPIHALRRGYVSEGEGERRERNSTTKMADTQKKIEGIGPITNDGMPVTLRSEVKDPSKWYKKMYDTIHKNKYDNDYVTIRYKSRRDEPQRVSSSKSQYAYFDPRSGYLSEPEGGLSRLTSGTWSDAYDSDVTSGPRRRTASVQEDRRNDITSPYLANNKYSTLASTRVSQEVYKSQPGKIENYTPGKSSVVDKEAKQWWDEVMDIFDGWLDDNSPLPPYSTLLARAIQKNQNMSNTTMSTTSLPKEKKDITSAILSKSNMARALKESGYESDSTLVFKRREETEGPLSPAERRAAYRDLQAGGEPPLRGFRSPAPPRTETDSTPEPPRRMPQSSFSDSESPSRRYVESDVNIHYRCPVRHDPLPLVPERELARQQAEHMKRLYREQKRNKYLQENDYHPIDIEAFDASIKELQDMQSRRHQDNFMPSQKTIVPLNRYDEADRVVARALYTFNGQTGRELSFRKGDIINVRRQIDNNWYEGEFHGRIGLFPYNYVELLKGDVAQSPKKPVILEGRARAKFDFTAQTNLELPLKKGELVVLARRIDHNWWEGRVGNKTGIFPDSYVTILQEPSQGKPEPQPILSTDKPVASPAAHGVVNGDKRSLGAHTYIPQHNSAALGNAPPATEPLIGYPAKGHSSPADRGLNASVNLNNTEPLYVDTNAEAVPYRAMYKYRPQNPDELELNEGDTVYVLEKCDDGWYVGSSQRTGRFGTFPGNYVERI